MNTMTVRSSQIVAIEYIHQHSTLERMECKTWVDLYFRLYLLEIDIEQYARVLKNPNVGGMRLLQ
jgi:hypothetical protein